MMKRTDPLPADPARLATAEDVRHVLGAIEDIIIAHILAVQPTYHELAEAAIWSRGDGDLAARESKDLSAAALAIANILVEADEGEPEER
jgi:hypothetical protein